MATKEAQRVVIVGAGPVGCLAAIYAANRGYNVEIYELRGDLRDPSITPLNFTKSINLALSERGINAMRHAGSPNLLQTILNETIPMEGRMIHGQKQGHLEEDPQPYDIHGRAIRAIDRGELNKKLLDELESKPNVKFYFNHKLVGADFKRKLAWFERHDATSDGYIEGKPNVVEIEVTFNFMIGADGAHSAVRFHLMKFARVSYQQKYIDTMWCEFHIPAIVTSHGPEFRLSKSHLHIWPCGDFMFIAIPSTDRSFTSTLFMSESKFAELDADDAGIVPFFKRNFPGVIPDLITAEEVVKQYKSNPHLPLVSIKCQPYHYRSSVVILGDAAHAMVPFYGQGMNAGLESTRVLFEHLDRSEEYFRASGSTSNQTPDALRGAALAAYTANRHPDALAICDLAFANYAEMSSHVRSGQYRLRKFVEEHLNSWFPRLGWATQYSRVSFGNERYSVVKASAKRQQLILRRITTLILGGAIGVSVFLLVRLRPLGSKNVWERIAKLWS